MTSALVVRGTLVLAVPAKDGLVVAADSLITVVGTGGEAFPGMQKIFETSRSNTVYAVSGAGGSWTNAKDVLLPILDAERLPTTEELAKLVGWYDVKRIVAPIISKSLPEYIDEPRFVSNIVAAVEAELSISHPGAEPRNSVLGIFQYAKDLHQSIIVRIHFTPKNPVKHAVLINRFDQSDSILAAASNSGFGVTERVMTNLRARLNVPDDLVHKTIGETSIDAAKSLAAALLNDTISWQTTHPTSEGSGVGGPLWFRILQ